MAAVPFSVSTPAAREALAQALATRIEPEIELRPPRVRRLGRCRVEIRARLPAESDRVRAALRARNGAGWRGGGEAGADVDDFRATLRDAIDQAADAVEDGTPPDDQRALAIVVDFIARNHDLFGIDRTALESAEWSGRSERMTPTLWRTYQLDGERPQPGLEQYPLMSRRWRLAVSLGHGGAVRTAFGFTGVLPATALCDHPRLERTDPRVTAHVIGHELSFFDAAGQHQSAGPVTAGDIASIKLTAFETMSDDRSRTVVQLAYAIEVTSPKVGLTEPAWRLFVDPDTGAIVGVRQLFWT